MSGQKASTQLTDDILEDASNNGARLFRQNVGLGWVGKVIKRTSNSMVIQHPRPLHAGLCVGSSDIIGITPVVITEDMVGQTIGVFTAPEIKAGLDQPSEQQLKFIAMVKKLGGFAGICRNMDDYKKMIRWK
jgi:ribosomal protein S19